MYLKFNSIFRGVDYGDRSTRVIINFFDYTDELKMYPEKLDF